jgi:hypothetical protein
VQLAPDDALAHDILGVSLAFQSKLDEALAEFEQATRLNPGDASIRDHYQTTLQDARRHTAPGAR